MERTPQHTLFIVMLRRLYTMVTQSIGELSRHLSRLYPKPGQSVIRPKQPIRALLISERP